MNGDITLGPPPAPANFPKGRIRICGVINWTCRRCGQVNHRRVQWWTYPFRCSNRLCKRVMLPVQHDVPHANKHRPWL